MEDTSKLPESLPLFIEQLKKQNVDSDRYAYAIDRYLDTKARLKGVPIYGKFELTPLCNLDCKMCYVHLHKNQMQNTEHLSLDNWKSIIKSAVDAGMVKAELTGGECLAYPDFDEIYLYLQSFGVSVSVFTNGILLDEDRIEFFKEHPPEIVQITLYGSCEDAYERVTGHRQFNRVYGNIMNAKAAGLPVQIAITPNAFMGNDGKELVKKAYETGYPVRINFSLLDPNENTGRRGTDIDASLEQYVIMNRTLYDLKGKSPVFLDENSLPDLGNESSEKRYGIICGAGRSAFSINWKGEMLPCNNLFVTGYPLSEGFEEAWKKTNMAALEYERPVECLTCKYKSMCISCAALHLQGGKKGHANPALCEKAMRLIDEGIIRYV